jgi:hypothetical protein
MLSISISLCLISLTTGSIVSLDGSDSLARVAEMNKILRAQIDESFRSKLAKRKKLHLMPRISLNSPHAFEELKSYVSRNVAVILTDTGLWGEGDEFKSQWIHDAVANMNNTDSQRYTEYVQGGGLGRGTFFPAEVMHSVETWNWPWGIATDALHSTYHGQLVDTRPRKKQFPESGGALWKLSSGYGSYVPEDLNNANSLLDKNLKRHVLHTDWLHCRLGFAAAVSGVKFYWQQAPVEDATAEEHDNFYRDHAQRAIGSPSLRPRFARYR